jgi:hypothetical protein
MFAMIGLFSSDRPLVVPGTCGETQLDGHERRLNVKHIHTKLDEHLVPLLVFLLGLVQSLVCRLLLWQIQYSILGT